MYHNKRNGLGAIALGVSAVCCLGLCLCLPACGSSSSGGGGTPVQPSDTLIWGQGQWGQHKFAAPAVSTARGGPGQGRKEPARSR